MLPLPTRNKIESLQLLLSFWLEDRNIFAIFLEDVLYLSSNLLLIPWNLGRDKLIQLIRLLGKLYFYKKYTHEFHHLSKLFISVRGRLIHFKPHLNKIMLNVFNKHIVFFSKKWTFGNIKTISGGQHILFITLKEGNFCA